MSEEIALLLEMELGMNDFGLDVQDRMEVRIEVESNNGLEGLAYDPV